MIKYWYSLIVAMYIVLMPAMVFAQALPLPKETTPPTPTVAAGNAENSIKQLLCTPTGDGNDLVNCINKLYKFAIAIGLAAAVLFTVLAGYSYMSGTQEGVTEAKNIVGSTIAGLVILFTSFLLLKQINPELIKFKPIQLPTIADPGICKLGDVACSDKKINSKSEQKSCNFEAYFACIGKPGAIEAECRSTHNCQNLPK